MASVLSLDSVDKRFGDLHVTRAVSLRLERGKIHGLIGPNGAGKTTLVSQITGQLTPDAGSISFAGQDITHLPVYARARLGLARSFQISSVFLPISVRENLAIALRGHLKRHWGMLRPTMRDKALVARAEALAERFGLSAELELPAADLSHGGRRRVELAMTLALEPSCVLLDEPLAGLSADEIDVIAPIIQSIAANDAAVLLIEHDMDSVFRLSDEITVLVDGAVLASGAPEAIRTNSDVRARYLS